MYLEQMEYKQYAMEMKSYQLNYSNFVNSMAPESYALGMFAMSGANGCSNPYNIYSPLNTDMRYSPLHQAQDWRNSELSNPSNLPHSDPIAGAGDLPPGTGTPTKTTKIEKQFIVNPALEVSGYHNTTIPGTGDLSRVEHVYGSAYNYSTVYHGMFGNISTGVSDNNSNVMFGNNGISTGIDSQGNLKIEFNISLTSSSSYGFDITLSTTFIQSLIYSPASSPSPSPSPWLRLITIPR
jgi:hypothetical protein